MLGDNNKIDLNIFQENASFSLSCLDQNDGSSFIDLFLAIVYLILDLTLDLNLT